MKPEYQIKVEGLAVKEKIVSGLLESNHIVSVKKSFGDTYTISIYGKERVDGKGMKEAQEEAKIDGVTGIISTPYKPQQPWRNNNPFDNTIRYK